MSTIYPQALQERISSLTVEFAQLEQQHTAVCVSLPVKPTRENKRQHMKDWLESRKALRKVERQLRSAKRLVARTQGDEYVFQKT
jgi:hypothetical protein